MAATTVATNLVEALDVIKPNIHSLHEGGADLKALLSVWRAQFFPLIVADDADQAFINRWVVPTLAIEGGLTAGVQNWFLLNKVVSVVSSTLAAARWNGYMPPVAQEAAMVAAFNAAWT